MRLYGVRSLGISLCLAMSALLTACSDEPNANAREHIEIPLHFLSGDGVGPINTSTPFNLKLLGEAFQNYNVTQETNFKEGDAYPVITVKQRTKPILSINPDTEQKKIFSVVVHDNHIGNRLTHRIGTRFADIYPFDKREKCASGMEEWSGKVLCYAPETGNILYLFEGKWDGPDSEVPPDTILADWKLNAMIWKPPLYKKGS